MGGKSVGGGRKWTHGVSFVLPRSGVRCVWRMRDGRATQLEMQLGGSTLVGSVSSLILASDVDATDRAELMAQGRAQIERQQAARKAKGGA
jgi:hypothetical protein